MNVTCREQFDQLLKDLRTALIIVIDTETNGLDYYSGTRIISKSYYFPEYDRSYNVAFRHGEGQVEVKYNKHNRPDMTFEEMNWSGKAKKQLYLRYWYQRFMQGISPDYFENLPVEWMEELKAVWGRPDALYVLHNARFDLHMLNSEGFPNVHKVEDTMIALHIVHEDWSGIELQAPFVWKKADVKAGKCQKDVVGKWARNADGTLMLKKQFGNRQLKWQSAFHQFEGATEGEEGLQQAISAFENRLIDFIMENWDDPHNAGLLYKTFANGKDRSPEMYAKQRKKIAEKLSLDPKANMWMLPSSLVSHYAELDTILTWKLREWCKDVIISWDNWELYQTMNRVLLEIAWRMEVNGVKIDVEQARKEIAKLTPRIGEVEAVLTEIAMFPEIMARRVEFGDKKPETFNANSPQKLVPFINAVLPFEIEEIFPEWWDTNRRGKLKTYPETRITETKKEQLDKVSDHPVVRLVRENRRMRKSRDTYLRRWLKARDPNNIIHGNMNPDGTVAGRFSSSGKAGNWQNIPDRNGYTIKRAIVPYDPQHIFVGIDYGQLEARLAAWIAENLLGLDPKMTMTNLFLQDVDMHAYTRDMVGVRDVVFPGMSDKEILSYLGHDLATVPEDEWSGKVADYCRYMAKTMNFGLLYSGTEYMLSKLLKIDRPSAKVLVDKWRSLFPAFGKAQQHFTELALKRRLAPDGQRYEQYVTQPISGRHRKLSRYSTWFTFYKDGRTQGFNPQKAASEKVWNNTDQGLGGYLTPVSLLRFGDACGWDGVKPFAIIHDAIDAMWHIDYLHKVPDLMKMMCAWDIIPGLTVDLSASPDNWHDMKKVHDIPLWIDSKGQDGYTKPKKK